MTKTQQAKLAEITAAGPTGLVVRDLTAAIHTLKAAGLVTVERNAPIKRQGAASWNYRVTATGAQA